jgi:mannose-6-phosphate isomerase
MTNTVRPYAWGSRTAIPALLGTEPTGEPQAELWMGAHPGAPSRLEASDTPLDAAIAADPEAELGPETVAGFGPRLPFLLKVLAAAQPLSLQVHPDLGQARDGFADEERRGVPIDAADRNYKDANHKPEMLVALGDFDGLCGFRRATEAADLLDGLGVPELAPYVETLRTKPEPEALREVLTAVLSAAPGGLPVDAVAAALPTAPALSAHARTAYRAIAENYPGDPGVLAALLLNHVRLAAGEALFLGAGVPHAYLSGLGVEIMANSDNVLRCGLTPKHVDVPELLRIVRFRGTDPEIVRSVPAAPGEQLYPAPVPDFRLSRIDGGPAGPVLLEAGRPQILLCTAGTAELSPAQADGETIRLSPGRSAYLPAHGPAARIAVAPGGTVFRSTVNLPEGSAR